MNAKATMAMLMQQDLQRRGHHLELGDCEAVLARVLSVTASLSRQVAVMAVEMPLRRTPAQICAASGETELPGGTPA